MKWKKVVLFLIITAGLSAMMWFGVRYYKLWKVGAAITDANVQAFLKMIRFAENRSVPDEERYYRVYGNLRVSDLSAHPVETGEWLGKILPDEYCIGAGFDP